MPTRSLFGRRELRRVGRHVKLVRERAGLAQARVAELSGLAERSIRDFETGRSNPSLATLASIAAALDVPLDDLVAVAREPSPQPILTTRDAVSAPRTALTPPGDGRLHAEILTLGEEDAIAAPPEGFVFGHVLEGRASADLAGRTVLGPGDSLHARATAVGTWRSAGEHAVVLVVAIAEQANERSPKAPEPYKR